MLLRFIKTSFHVFQISARDIDTTAAHDSPKNLLVKCGSSDHGVLLLFRVTIAILVTKAEETI